MFTAAAVLLNWLVSNQRLTRSSLPVLEESYEPTASRFMDVLSCGFGKLDWPTSAVYFSPPLVSGFLSLVEEAPEILTSGSYRCSLSVYLKKLFPLMS